MTLLAKLHQTFVLLQYTCVQWADAVLPTGSGLLLMLLSSENFWLTHSCLLKESLSNAKHGPRLFSPLLGISHSGLFKSRNSCVLRLYSGGSLMTDPFKTDRLIVQTNRKAKEVGLHIFLLLTVEVYIFSMQTLNIMVSVNFLVF